ncbi:PREDICTED: reverse mRNAase, partial [Prunus dulcis]
VEVKEAVFQMGGMKAPGPNGFQGMFYQTYWDTILAEVHGTMKDFFEIQDNIILAHEVFHYLKLRKSKKVFEMGVKLDMNKAYDRVEWDFLEAVMIRMGFTMSWVELIISCIITGDPLSPYLFLLVSEVLSLLVLKACESGFLQGIKLSRSGPTLSHLMFADDTLIFLRATEHNYRNMVQLLNAYCRASEQQISLAKSTIFFSPNTPSNLGQQIYHILGMPR